MKKNRAKKQSQKISKGTSEAAWQRNEDDTEAGVR